jgi:hypothetical protein
MESGEFTPLLAAGGALLLFGIASFVALIAEEEDADNARKVEILARGVTTALLTLHNGGDSPDDEPPRKRRFILWDHDRAKRCIMADYLGEAPKFALDDFKRIFRVSRSSYDNIRNYLGRTDNFFRDGYDSVQREKISVDSKILMALKYLAYGCSVNSFRDYFQMGESTAMKCVKMFTKALATSEEFKDQYLPSITPGDANRIEALHYHHHGIRGMISSLDCSHFVLGNCPVAYHGQFQGKEEKPTIVMETMCDHNLYAWHTVFGYCGTLNDINIWDSSMLQKAFCDGSFSTCDFPLPKFASRSSVGHAKTIL